MEGSDTLVRQHEVYFRTWEAVAMEAVPEETQEAALDRSSSTCGQSCHNHHGHSGLVKCTVNIDKILRNIINL